MDIKFNFVLSSKANEDLEQIAQYFNEMQQFAYGEKLNDELRKKILTACKEPFLYQFDSDVSLFNQSVRRIPVNGYIIYYIANETKQCIEVVRIRSNKQDNKNLVI